MKKMFKNKILSLIVVFALAVTALFGVAMLAAPTAANAQEANVYYVSPDATYGQKGEVGNRNMPYDIITLLNNGELKAGDTVKVLPGVYDIGTRIILKVSGSYNSYITIENDSDTEQATLSFYKQIFSSTNRGVSIEGNYIHWNDIDVCGAGDNGLYIGGSYNIVENCEFYDNRDSGLQLGRSNGELTSIEDWPSYNLIKNCTSHNNYDNETYGENADGFAAKLTVGYGNVFDGCMAYRNSDDGWDLYAKVDSGNIGSVIIYNSVAFENGFLEYSQAECNAKFPTYNKDYDEANTASFNTRDGDGNGFKLGGSVMEGDVVLNNCLAFGNKYHGVTDNSNPGVISLTNVTSYDNNRAIDASGNIVKESSDLGGANIDLARQTYSYNNIDKVLSVKSSSATSVTNDAYRASVQNSVLRMGSDSYEIVGALDADTKSGINGKKVKALNEEAFLLLPIDHKTSTYNMTGVKDFAKGAERIHLKYRNADGSINLGNILAVKTQPIDGLTIGATLNKASYEEYPHLALDHNYAACETETDAILKAASDILTIACNQAAVYQDFWVPANMKDVTIEWTSSDTSVMEVNEKEKELYSASGTKFSYVTVKRDVNEDKTATLSARITANGKSVTKKFDLTVKMDEPRIGDIFVKVKGKNIYSGDSFIVNHYAIATEPEIQVVNGANYSGSQFVKGSQFTDEVTYEYATSKLSNFVEVREFTPNNAGVWHITHKVTLNSSKEVKTYDYYIYVASTIAKVDFTEPAEVTVNREGYMIAGNLSNVTGYIYAVSSKDALEVTKENIKTLENVEVYSFTSDAINFQFSNSNESGYNVYYALANMRGEITSEIYHDEIAMMDVDTEEAFMKVAAGQKIGEETVSKTIYSLTKCLDFTDITWQVGSESFDGYLVGNGHTVKNVTVKGAGLFNKVEGGTIADINFENIVIDNGSGQKNGIISTVYGGTLENINVHNVRVTGGQRTGAFIGQIFESSVPTIVSKVNVVNDMPEIGENGRLIDETNGYYVKANGTRASSLIGFIQPSSAPETDVIVRVSNCFTNVYTWATSYSVGGIVAEYDDSKGATTDLNFELEIRNCYTTSVLVGTGSSSRMGGMLGYHKGGGKLNVTGCFSRSTAYFANMKVDVAQKNISGIIGNFAATGATVSKCGSIIEEYNTDFGVTAYSESMFQGQFGKSIITSTMEFDTEVWELCYKEGSTDRLVAPYLKLKASACTCSAQG